MDALDLELWSIWLEWPLVAELEGARAALSLFAGAPVESAWFRRSLRKRRRRRVPRR